MLFIESPQCVKCVYGRDSARTQLGKLTMLFIFGFGRRKRREQTWGNGREERKERRGKRGEEDRFVRMGGGDRFLALIGDGRPWIKKTNLFPEDGIGLVSSDTEGVALQLEVDRGVVIAHVRHVCYAVYRLRHDVSVLHCDLRNLHARHRADVTRPHACTHTQTIPFYSFSAQGTQFPRGEILNEENKFMSGMTTVRTRYCERVCHFINFIHSFIHFKNTSSIWSNI